MPYFWPYGCFYALFPMKFPQILLAAAGLLLPFASSATAAFPGPAANAAAVAKAAPAVRIDPTYWWWA